MQVQHHRGVGVVLAHPQGVQGRRRAGFLLGVERDPLVLQANAGLGTHRIAGQAGLEDPAALLHLQARHAGQRGQRRHRAAQQPARSAQQQRAQLECRGVHGESMVSFAPWRLHPSDGGSSRGAVKTYRRVGKGPG